MTLPELFSNYFQTSLTGPVGSGDATIPVQAVAPTALQASGQFRILIINAQGGNSELLLVTGGASTLDWQVTRGIEGTTALSHSVGDQVTHITTAGALGGQSDAVAGVPSLRSLGTGATQAAQGSALATETSRATTAESSLSSAIAAETARAEAAEAAIGSLGDLDGGTPTSTYVVNIDGGTP